MCISPKFQTDLFSNCSDKNGLLGQGNQLVEKYKKISRIITLIKKKLIYKEIQNGAVAKSSMTNDLLIYGEIFAHFLIHIRKPFLIYDFATAPI